MPLLQKNWHTSLPLINLTLSGFSIGFCLSMLFYGPLSHRLGSQYRDCNGENKRPV